MKKLSTTQIWLLSIVFFITIGVMGEIDIKDAKIAEQQAQYVKQLAQQEDEECKREFNVLAFEGEYMTGFAGDMK